MGRIWLNKSLIHAYEIRSERVPCSVIEVPMYVMAVTYQKTKASPEHPEKRRWNDEGPYRHSA